VRRKERRRRRRRRRLVPSFDTSFTVMILLINFLVVWTISSHPSAFLWKVKNAGNHFRFKSI
jgi:hypothetical protein